MLRRVLSFITSLVVICGFSLKIGESGWIFQESRSFLWLPLFLILNYEINFSLTTQKTKLISFSAIPACIISLCHIFGYTINEKGTVLWLLRNENTVGLAFLHFLSWFIILCLIFLRFFALFSENTIVNSSTIRPNFLILWVVFVIAWFPWFLNQFPAVMTADTTDQIEMALGIEPITDHHPVFHTFLIQTALNAGEQIFGKESSYQSGIIIYSAIQFLIMTAVIAMTMRFIIDTDTYRVIKIGTFFFFLLYPVHPLYSITIWKDVPFSVFLLLLITLLADTLINKKQNNFIRIAGAGLLVSLLRHNGIYLLLLSLPFIPMIYKKQRKSIFIAFLSAISLYLVWKSILLPAMKIPSGEASEALSIPLQQVALTMKRQHTTMDKTLISSVEKFFSEPNIWKLYDKRISDPVKNVFSEDRYNDDPFSFWKIWISLGIKYPQDYLDAFLIHTYGYWYPETPHFVFITGIDNDGLFGIHTDPKLDTTWTKSIIQWLSESKYDNIPLLSLLFSPGACFWVYLLLFSYCLYRKSPVFFLFIPLIILWLTAIASPVNCEYRYVYGMFLCCPVIITALFNKKTSA